MTDAKELQGKTALVTGGSRGIGLAIGRALAAGGARVALVARNGEAAAAAAAALPGEGHGGFACDVSDAASVQAMVQAVESAMGDVQILVNNAGVTRDGLVVRMKDEDWDEVIDINLKGAFYLTRAVAKGMMRRREGVILNITSVVGLMGNAGQANYAASKAGMLGLTMSVARELAPRGVRVNAIAPGYITTDMTAGMTDDQKEALQGQIPLGRLGAPEDIAHAARFLAGPGATYITGQVLTVDGGMVM